MTRKALADTWAWSQIEAAADGSLGSEQSRRMAEAMEKDAELRAAVEHAVALRRALGSIAPARVPKGLLGKLLALPGRESAQANGGSIFWRRTRFALVPAAVALAVVTAVIVTRTPPEPDPRRIAALEDFSTAMAYVRQSALITNDAIAEQVRFGVREALDTSRDSLREKQTDTEDGD